MKMNTINEALAGIEGGATIHVGGFGLVGIPENLIFGLRDIGVRNLTIISNNCGIDDCGLGLLVETRQLRSESNNRLIGFIFRGTDGSGFGEGYYV